MYSKTYRIRYIIRYVVVISMWYVPIPTYVQVLPLPIVHLLSTYFLALQFLQLVVFLTWYTRIENFHSFSAYEIMYMVQVCMVCVRCTRGAFHAKMQIRYSETLKPFIKSPLCVGICIVVIFEMTVIFVRSYTTIRRQVRTHTCTVLTIRELYYVHSRVWYIAQTEHVNRRRRIHVCVQTYMVHEAKDTSNSCVRSVRYVKYIVHSSTYSTYGRRTQYI